MLAPPHNVPIQLFRKRRNDASPGRVKPTIQEKTVRRLRFLCNRRPKTSDPRLMRRSISRQAESAGILSLGFDGATTRGSACGGPQSGNAEIWE